MLNSVSVQVYEDRQKRTELEMEEFRQTCAAKMQKSSHKAQREQQLLQHQVFQLQQEKKKQQEDMTQLLQERQRLEDRCASFEREHTQLGPRLEETKWEVRSSDTLDRKRSEKWTTLGILGMSDMGFKSQSTWTWNLKETQPCFYTVSV